MSNETDSIQLHDGVVESLKIDYSTRTADLVVSYYGSDQDVTRQRATISFQDVASIEHVANLEELADNASAGNINHWKLPNAGK